MSKVAITAAIMVVIYIYAIIFIAVFINGDCNLDAYAHTPKQIIEISNLTLFGATMVWIFMVITNPIYFVVLILRRLFVKRR